jgi:long-chain acyl-CoA synthetase
MKRVPAKRTAHHRVCALPLYHIFAFTVDMTLVPCARAVKMILIPEPARFAGGVRKSCQSTRSTVFLRSTRCSMAWPTTLILARVDWSQSEGLGGRRYGGAPVRWPALWLEKTGCPICEGYGLSETSPSASCNPTTRTAVHRAPLACPLPSTFMKLLDDEGKEVTALASPVKLPSRARK